MKKRAIIFDLYGVLGLNGWQAFKHLHFADRPEAWEHLRRLGQQVDAGEASNEQLVTALADVTGESKDTVRYQFEHTLPNTALLQFIAEHLRFKYKLGLLSNASRDVLGDIFSPEQLALFDAAISSFHVGLTKPDPRIFMMMCDRLGVQPQECLIIDDKQRHLDAARKLGFDTVLFESVSQAEQAIIDRLT